ncbi:MAG: ATP-binding cassette domain-containing protein [Candidatus Delongbacteria bacterium]|nr:ATP-binding cassette domain-containing protein [Candidatus Delongbacteria bacterium]MDD4204571.1 ATP-binding cassette domain-containing protein [Candidatus Delongbacteria bacterium]
MEKENVIEIKNLTAGFDGRTVLENISLEIKRNEIFVILGSSGGGKTTLLKHIIGLLKPEKGSISVFGKEILNMEIDEFEGILKRIGMLFQGGALLNSMAVWENIAIPLEQHTQLENEVISNIVKQKLSLVNLEDAYYMLPSELSGGMKKRVSLARAIAMDPEILFFDEPSAGLDPITSSDLDELILDLKKKLGITLVIVTHELESIKRIADRIIYLQKGKNIFCGTIEEAKISHIEEIDRFFGWDKD